MYELRQCILFFDNLLKDTLTNKNRELLSMYCDGTTHYNLAACPILEEETKLNLLTIIKH
jgi:hypothetical protein